eukprot:jgi/Chlat1/6298/Chrsp44S05879
MQAAKDAVDAFKRHRLVDQATANNDDVAPVYAMNEICELTRGASLEIIRDLQDHINKRIDNKSPFVKQKALRVIRGDPTFRREMQRHAGAVRALVHYKGVQDELRGDAPNKAVREAAQEAVKAMFDSEPAQSTAQSSNVARGRIQGFGSSEYGASPKNTSSYQGPDSKSSGMIGFGNTRFDNDRPASTSSRSGATTSRQWPSWGAANGGDSSHNSVRGSTTDQLYGAGSPQYSPKQQHGGVSTSAVAAGIEPGVEEARLVTTITAPGGVRAQPSQEALRSFLQTAATLDGAALASELQSKLESSNWQVRLRALCVVEAVARHGDSHSTQDILLYIRDSPAALIACTESPHASVRDKAKKLLPLLQDGDSDYSDTAAAPSVQAPQVDLLDFNGDFEVSEPSIQTDDLFTGLSVAPGASVTEAPTTSASAPNLLGSPGGPTSTSGSLFDGLSVSDRAAAPSAARGDSVEDLFSSLSVGDGPVLLQASGSSNANNPLVDLMGLSSSRVATSNASAGMGPAASLHPMHVPSGPMPAQQQRPHMMPYGMPPGQYQGMMPQQGFSHQGPYPQYPGMQYAAPVYPGMMPQYAPPQYPGTHPQMYGNQYAPPFPRPPQAPFWGDMLVPDSVPGVVGARAGVELPPTPKKPDAFDFIATQLKTSHAPLKK